MRKGKEHQSWKGGRFVDNGGYVRINISTDPIFADHAYIDNTVLEHRYVMAKHLGRILERNEHVHHKNGIKTDNRLKNLELMSAAEHSSHHHKGIRRTEIKPKICKYCREIFTTQYNSTRKDYCSKKCFKFGIRGKRKITPVRICQFCKRKFTPEFPSSKNIFCSIPCANEANQIKRNPEKRKSRICEYCKGQYFPVSRLSQRFCSISCGGKNRGK